MTETRRLGRGLEALLGPVTREQAEAQGNLRELAVSQIQPNPFQPRRTFDTAALSELADSIKASGLLQPLVVRANGKHYELIAGERRWRAIQQLGWAKVPVVIREADDQALLTLALIENLQRDDLNPIDEALGYQRLMDEFSIPQGEVARLVGKDRSTISNNLRLLKLPSEVQQMLERQELTEGHARALLAISSPEELIRQARLAFDEGWSVRETEARVRGETLSRSGREAPARRTLKPKPPVTNSAAEIRRVEDALRKRLGTDVKVTARRKGRGTIALTYYSNDDLSRLLELILGSPFDG